jgi:hypothetical protein
MTLICAESLSDETLDRVLIAQAQTPFNPAVALAVDARKT